MRPPIAAAILLAALSSAACHPKSIKDAVSDASSSDTSSNSSSADSSSHDEATHPIQVGQRLDCPDSVGDLTRTAAAADGASCAYQGPQAEKVELTLTPLNGGTPDARLAGVEQQLKAEMGPMPAGGVHIASDGDHDHAKIDFPGFHLDADNGKASIRMPGVSINANGDDAQVKAGFGGAHTAVVNAHAGGAEIRAGAVTANGADLTYVLAADKPGPGGWRAVGYMAKGPAAGPLVVATFRSPGEEHHGDLHDIGLRRLIDLNAHG